MPGKLEDLYKPYWEFRSRDWRTAIHRYLTTVEGLVPDLDESKSLLALEMACAESRPEHSQLPYRDPDKRVTLVYLVGTAYEPLFQSIWAHRPDKLIPVVNRYYGSRLPKPEKPGDKFWSKLAKGISKLPPERIGSLVIDPADITEDDLVEDSPTAVFDYLHRKLRDDLRDPQCEIVIDITGAKKTMVAGAFMFAAYTNARIYYIDADYYKGERPYGFSCRFREIESPLDKLSLAIWRQIEEQYRADNFLGALQLLETILGDGDNQSETPLRQLESVQQFRKLLSIISAWDRGQLDEAHQLLQDRQPHLAERLQPYIPTAVAVLSPYWNQPTISEIFFGNQQAIILYAHDELARIHRLQRKKHHRSAFTRAYALCETLLKSRVVALFMAGRLTQQLALPNKENTLLLQLLKTQPQSLCRILTGNRQTVNSIPLTWETPGQSGYLPDSLNPYGANAYLRNTRNLITHNYVAAEPGLTAQVIQWAADNLADYETNWGNLLPVDKPTKEMLNQARYAPPSWEEIRRDCRLDFIPDLNVKEGS